MPLPRAPFVIAGLLFVLPAAAPAQQPWVDAGQQAMIQHNNTLLEQQTTPDQQDKVEEVRQRRREILQAADERCNPDAVKARLRPEYERRVRAEGAAAAGEWLRQQGAEAGRYAAGNC